MRKFWWKILGVLILLYVLIAGLLVPLKPGISGIEPKAFRTGQTASVEVVGYNTFFTKTSGTHRAWIKLDSVHSLAAQEIKVINDTHLELSFRLPPGLPFQLPEGSSAAEASLLLDNDYDGAMIAPGQLSIIPGTADPNSGIASQMTLWSSSPIEKLHTKAGWHFPFRTILYESIRNTYFHVSLWFAMLFMFITSVVFSVRYLRKFNAVDDHKALAFTTSGLLFGIMGIVTGSIWAKDTWGTYWTWEEVKMNMTAIALLIYLAYFVLRASFDDNEKRARISAVYNLFAFAALIPLIYVVPRMTDSLHPGSGGNPALGGEDLDNTMRMVFYPAIIGWTLIGVWLSSLLYRARQIEEHLLEEG